MTALATAPEARYEHVGNWDVWTMPRIFEDNVPTLNDPRIRKFTEWRGVYSLRIPEHGIATQLELRKERLTHVGNRTQRGTYSISVPRPGAPGYLDTILVSVTRTLIHGRKNGVAVDVMAQLERRCEDCDCADPTALPGLAAECDCECHR